MANAIITAFFSVLATVCCWSLARRLYKRFRHPLVNPVFVSVAGIIALLLCLHVDYDRQYRKGGDLLKSLLDPAVVAFAVPLYRQRRKVVENARPIAVAVIIGSVVGIISASGAVLLLGGSHEIARTLAPKSVTTPIAMKLSEEIGGEEDLTAGIVIVTGILGAMFGPEFLRRLRVKSRLAVGLAVGTASHGIGTARMEEEDRHYGDDEGKAASMIGMILNGVVTALIIHWCLLIMGISVPQN
jgi:predicted murein hydrolase (TIGR00659 family)